MKSSITVPTTAFDHFRPTRREECGIFGIYNHPDAAKLTYFGLYALQHRGQESAGIVVSDGREVLEYMKNTVLPINRPKKKPMSPGYSAGRNTSAPMLSIGLKPLVRKGGSGLTVCCRECCP